MKIKVNTKINNITKEIAKRNKLFEQASPAQKRVLIAKDVINLIKSGKITPMTGEWVYPSYKDESDDESFQKTFLKGNVEDCECCALGSMMLSCTLFKNKVKVNEVNGGALDYPNLAHGHRKDVMGFRGVFPDDQCKLIEIAFECGYGYYGPGNDGQISDRAVKFGNKYRTERKRLLAIMNNIVKNKGTFKP